MRPVLSTSLLVLAACATTSGSSAPETEFVPTGEVRAYNRIANFDATRVRGSGVNVSRRGDGSWGGVLGSRPIDVSVTNTHIRGAEILMTREESSPGKQVYTGQFQGRIYRFEINDQQAIIRTPSISLNYPGRVVSDGAVKYGQMGALELRGEAGAETPPWPQLAFALIAAFN